MCQVNGGPSRRLDGERERDVLDRLVLVDWVWVGYVCVRGRWRDVRSFMAAVFAVVAIFVS